MADERDNAFDEAIDDVALDHLKTFAKDFVSEQFLTASELANKTRNHQSAQDQATARSIEAKVEAENRLIEQSANIGVHLAQMDSKFFRATRQRELDEKEKDMEINLRDASSHIRQLRSEFEITSKTLEAECSNIELIGKRAVKTHDINLLPLNLEKMTLEAEARVADAEAGFLKAQTGKQLSKLSHGEVEVMGLKQHLELKHSVLENEGKVIDAENAKTVKLVEAKMLDLTIEAKMDTAAANKIHAQIEKLNAERELVDIKPGVLSRKDIDILSNLGKLPREIPIVSLLKHLPLPQELVDSIQNDSRKPVGLRRDVDVIIEPHLWEQRICKEPPMHQVEVLHFQNKWDIQSLILGTPTSTLPYKSARITVEIPIGAENNFTSYWLTRQIPAPGLLEKYCCCFPLNNTTNQYFQDNLAGLIGLITSQYLNTILWDPEKQRDIGLMAYAIAMLAYEKSQPHVSSSHALQRAQIGRSYAERLATRLAWLESQNEFDNVCCYSARKQCIICSFRLCNCNWTPVINSTSLAHPERQIMSDNILPGDQLINDHIWQNGEYSLVPQNVE